GGARATHGARQVAPRSPVARHGLEHEHVLAAAGCDHERHEHEAGEPHEPPWELKRGDWSSEAAAPTSITGRTAGMCSSTCSLVSVLAVKLFGFKPTSMPPNAERNARSPSLMRRPSTPVNSASNMDSVPLTRTSSADRV